MTEREKFLNSIKRGDLAYDIRTAVLQLSDLFALADKYEDDKALLSELKTMTESRLDTIVKRYTEYKNLKES